MRMQEAHSEVNYITQMDIFLTVGYGFTMAIQIFLTGYFI